MRILLIDDHMLFGKSIKMILELDDSIETVDIWSPNFQLNRLIEKQYDIILLDINLTKVYEADGFQMAKQILALDGNSKIIFLTGYNRALYEYQAKELGAYSFVDKSIDPAELLDTMKNVYQGKKCFKKIEEKDILTDRERQILTLIKEGKTIDEICGMVFISKRTVSNHLNSIFSKLNTTNRLEAVNKAEKLGYFLPE